MIDSLPTYRPMTPFGVVMGRLVARLDAWLFRRRQRSQLVNTLVRMTDRDLHDLGISRADFPTIIEGTYRR